MIPATRITYRVPTPVEPVPFVLGSPVSFDGMFGAGRGQVVGLYRSPEDGLPPGVLVEVLVTS